MPETSEFWDEWDNAQEEAENAIEGEPGKVKLYVEGDTDIPSWYAIFKRFAPALKIEFVFHSFSKSEKSDEKKVVKGKATLLQQAAIKKESVGSRKLICVDSDYDFLVPTTEHAKTIRSRRPYILQTYTYGIENYKCLAESLECICVDATYNSELEFDFQQFLRNYSKAVYELFVYSIYSHRKGLDLSIECRGNVAVGDCLNLINNGTETIEKIKQKVQKAIETAKKNLIRSHPGFETEIDRLKKILEKRGVKPENVYLFMDAHILYDGVVSPALRNAIKIPKGKKHKEVESKAKETGVDDNTKQEWHENYKKMILDPIALLNVNKAHFYHDCLPLKCIERDIKSYLDKHPIGTSTSSVSAPAQ